MTRNERKLKAVEDTMAKKAQAIQEYWDKEAKEDRELGEDERADVVGLVKALDELKVDKREAEANIALEQEVKEASRGLGLTGSTGGGLELGEEGLKAVQVPQGPQDLGAAFTESEGYKSIEGAMKSGNRREFTIPSVSLETKGTLTEGVGSGAALAAPVPQVIPGAVAKLFQRNVLADLIGSGQATTNSIRYVVEGTATSGAAGVAEAELKPESTLGLSTVDEPVKKIATVLPVSEETLEDASQVQTYINGRLVLFVQNEEDRQLIRGSSANEVKGIIGRTGVNIYAGGTAAGNKAEQVFKALNGTRGSAFVEPDFIVMNPADWQDIRLLKDTAGQYFGGGPFLGPYGGPQGPIGSSGQVSGPIDQVWNKPVYITANIGAGTALVGTSSAAQVFRRGGLNVDASNSHASYFRENLVALRAEERLALAVYRPGAFTEIRLS